MSKSRGNVILPEEVISRFFKYGPDILRTYLMFLGPFDSTMIWNDDALMGVKKFLDRTENYVDSWLVAPEENKGNNEAKPFLHQTIKKITTDMGAMKFNTAVASLMEFLNKIKQFSESVNNKNNKNFLEKEDLKIFIILLAPFAPYFCEEQWQKIQLNKRGFWAKVFSKLNSKIDSVFQQSWPRWDEGLMQKKQIEMVIQINGKLRDRMLVQINLTEEEAKKMAKERQKIKEILADKKIKKIIFVPKKLINIVTN
jgi:leucyl-tRNA synthetase